VSYQDSNRTLRILSNMFELRKIVTLEIGKLHPLLISEFCSSYTCLCNLERTDFWVFFPVKQNILYHNCYYEPCQNLQTLFVTFWSSVYSFPMFSVYCSLPWAKGTKVTKSMITPFQWLKRPLMLLGLHGRIIDMTSLKVYNLSLSYTSFIESVVLVEV
jgi:hypothetical protein